MFWMFVKITLLALYVLSGLGVIVMNLTLQHDLKRYIKNRGIKFEPYSLSEKVSSTIRYWISIFCPIWNFIMFLVMVSCPKRILDEAIDKMMNR